MPRACGKTVQKMKEEKANEIDGIKGKIRREGSEKKKINLLVNGSREMKGNVGKKISRKGRVGQ